jgi:lysophospholipase L1-like esterase/anti-sigma-K factor RskA
MGIAEQETRFTSLVMAVVEETATAADLVEFHALLHEHSEFIFQYLEQMRIHGMMCRYAEDARSVGAENRKTRKRAFLDGSWWRRIAAVLVASAVVALAMHFNPFLEKAEPLAVEIENGDKVMSVAEPQSSTLMSESIRIDLSDNKDADSLSLSSSEQEEKSVPAADIQTDTDNSVTQSVPQVKELSGEPVSVALAGDSTVTDDFGWGGALSDFLPAGVSVNNRAIGGYSTKSFIDQGYWDSTVDLDCDYVFIQFGHNDQKLNDTIRGTYPAESRPLGINDRSYDLFRANLTKMVDDVRAEGGVPVLITPLARRGRVADINGVLQFQNDVVATDNADLLGNCYSLLDYADAAKAVAELKRVPLIDLNQLSLDLYNRMLADGEDITALGPDGDNTHLNTIGAMAIAKLIADAIPEVLPDSPLWPPPPVIDNYLLIFTNELDSASDYGSLTVLPNATADNPCGNTSDLDEKPKAVQVQTLITSAGAASVSFMSAAVCNPSILHGIGTINWSTEIRKAPDGYNDTPLCPALWQRGKLYVYVGGNIIGGDLAPNVFRETTETYSQVKLEGAEACHFESYDLNSASVQPPLTNSGDHPDFSNNGDSITFGYIASAGTGSTGYERRTAIRKSRITVAKYSPLRITTHYGHGADAGTDEYNKTTNLGDSVVLTARWSPNTNPAFNRHEQIVLRFDLSDIADFTIIDASLNLVKYRDHETGVQMDLYGIIDGKPGDALEDWSEGTLTYANAPWLNQDNSFDNTDLKTESIVKLDENFPTVGDSGDTMSSQTMDLLDFIRSDKNQLVTFILTREDMIESAQEKFASKETTQLEDGGGTGRAGDFAPSLILNLKFSPDGTIFIIK